MLYLDMQIKLWIKYKSTFNTNQMKRRNKRKLNFYRQNIAILCNNRTLRASVA